jgi:tetratricopeptide (TPR) repeat protein
LRTYEFQDRIAAQAAGAIHSAARKAEIDLAKRKPPNSLKAYEFVLRAYPNLWSQSQDRNQEAIALLGNALAMDPSYGRAHALLAWCLAQEVVYFWRQDPGKERARALGAVSAAGTSNDDDPTALAAAGAALSQCGDQDRAAAYIEKALALDHNNAWAWARYGWLALYTATIRPLPWSDLPQRNDICPCRPLLSPAVAPNLALALQDLSC